MQNHLTNILAVALGGGAGSIGRYGIALAAGHFSKGTYPYGTLVANIVGCLAIGFFWSFFDKIHISHEFRLFLFTGFLGGFTTFSTFGRESVQFFRMGDFSDGLGYIFLSNVFGLVAVAAGFYLGGRILRLI